MIQNTSTTDILPYHKNPEFDRELEKAVCKIYPECNRILEPIIRKAYESTKVSDNEHKSLIVELLTIGVLWGEHSQKASLVRDSTLVELQFMRNANLNNELNSSDFKEAYYTLRNHRLDSEFAAGTYPIVLSIISLEKLTAYLEATEEYSHELTVLKKWLHYWKTNGESRFLFDINSILNSTARFIEICNAEIIGLFNLKYFNDYIPSIKRNREDYFRVTKKLNEYYLNGICEVWGKGGVMHEAKV